MTKINKTANRILKITAGLMVLLAVLTLLAGCGSSKSSSGLTVSELTYEEGKNGVTKDELSAIAKVVAKSNASFEAFIAAYRGYDLASIEDKEADCPAKEPSTEYAIAVIKKYDDIDDTDGQYAALNVEDMLSIIKAIQQDVVLKDENPNFMFRLENWIGIFLAWITKYLGFGHYLVGICEFAILVEILMLPFGIRQQKNSIKQAQFRPKEMAIRKKYAGRNDQVTMKKMNQEIQDLYAKEGYSPMSGCLPLLLQLPIMYILYMIVINPISYLYGKSTQFANALKTFFEAPKAAGGLGGTLTSRNGTIEILSMIKAKGIDAFKGLKDFLFFSNGNECYEELSKIEIPTFNIGSVNFGLTPGFSKVTAVLLFIPVLTFIVYFFSAKLTKKMTFQPTVTQTQGANNGCSNNIMDITMPLFSVYITFIVPGLIGIYWVFRSVLSTFKQFILSRIMPLPKFTEEDYKAAERELNGKNGNRKVVKSENAGKVRSLHHIDDDDFDEPAPRPKKETKKDEPKTEEPKAEEASVKGVALAPLKEDPWPTEEKPSEEPQEEESSEDNQDEE